MSALAQRYAAALADAAQAAKCAEQVRRDVEEFAAALAHSADLRNALATPAIGPEVKKTVLAEIAARMNLRAETRNLLFVLVDQRRTGILEEIRAAFEREMNERLGIAQATVTSARELSTEDKTQLARTLERMTRKKVLTKYELDARVLGGARVRIGSTIYDGSVREQLHRLRTRLETP